MHVVLASQFCELLIMTPLLMIIQPKEPNFHVEKKGLTFRAVRQLIENLIETEGKNILYL